MIGLGGPAAAAAVPGFEVKITEVPGTFTAGAGPRTVTAVASTDTRDRCQKVRWSMLLQVEGTNLDEIRVDRVESSGSFPLEVEARGDVARLTDTQLDPGQLCRGRTVTARYRVAFTDDADAGKISFQAEAYDSRNRLLAQTRTTSTVAGGDDDEAASSPSPTPTREAEPSPTPSETQSPEPGLGESADDDAAATPAPTRNGAISQVPASANSDTPSLLGAGLIVGAVLIFLGVGLLMRLRLRSRDTTMMTAGFTPTR